MRIYMPAIFAVALLLFGSCKQPEDLTEAEVYNILNEIFADDTFPIHQVCWNFLEFNLKDEMRKEFSQRDITFIEKQNAKFKDLKIQPGHLKWYRRRHKDFAYTIVDSACNNGTVFRISFPFISNDRSKVLLNYIDDCNCMLGSQGSTNLYEKKNGRWILTKQFDEWISDKRKGNGGRLIVLNN